MALTVTVGDPRMVMDVPAWFPNAMHLKNGDILVQLVWGSDRHPTQEEFDEFYAMNTPTTEQDWMAYDARCREQYGLDRVHVLNGRWVRSTDGGKTYTETGLPPVIEYAQLENGDVVALQWYSYQDSEGRPIIRSWRSHDNCHSWDAPYDIPLICPPLGKLGSVFPHRRILHVKDDTFLVLIYGNLVGDEHNRSMVFRTTDGFRTLHYYSTAAMWHPGIGHPQGFNETDFTRTPDGRILCVVRNQGFYPLYQTESIDDGATWSAVRQFPGMGVDPSLCTLENGVVVCGYGRPGVNVAFSENNGENWQNITTLMMVGVETNGTVPTAEARPSQSQRSCCYTELVATGPDQVTVFYAAPKDWSDLSIRTPWNPQQRQHFRLYARDIRVERT